MGSGSSQGPEASRWSGSRGRNGRLVGCFSVPAPSPYPRRGRNVVSCPQHHGLCRYDADDPTRCPLCHVTWSLVLRRGWHSCEHGTSVWPPNMRKRGITMYAVMLRRQQEAVHGVRYPDDVRLLEGVY